MVPLFQKVVVRFLFSFGCVQALSHPWAAEILKFRRCSGGVLKEKVFLEISQNSHESTCARVFF